MEGDVLVAEPLGEPAVLEGFSRGGADIESACTGRAWSARIGQHAQPTRLTRYVVHHQFLASVKDLLSILAPSWLWLALLDWEVDARAIVVEMVEGVADESSCPFFVARNASTASDTLLSLPWWSWRLGWFPLNISSNAK